MHELPQSPDHCPPNSFTALLHQPRPGCAAESFCSDTATKMSSGTSRRKGYRLQERLSFRRESCVGERHPAVRLIL
jgi:hypothetical protein